MKYQDLLFRFLYRLSSKFLPKTEREKALEKRMEAIAIMIEKQELLNTKQSLHSFLTGKVPINLKDELKSKISYICDADHNSDNYLLVIDALINSYKNSASNFANSLVLFKENYYKKHQKIL